MHHKISSFGKKPTLAFLELRVSHGVGAAALPLGRSGVSSPLSLGFVLPEMRRAVTTLWGSHEH